MRPLGAVFLGAYIDRHGRRQGLIITLGLMAMGTLLIAFVPGYATLGVAAPLLVLFGRLLQVFPPASSWEGFRSTCRRSPRQDAKASSSVGSRPASRSRWSRRPARRALNQWLSPQDMGEWGWRVPFFIGCLIVPALFVIRRSLEETPEFEARTHRPSLSQVLRPSGRTSA